MRTKAHEYHTHGAHRSGIKSLSLILCIRMYGYVGMCAVYAPVCVYMHTGQAIKSLSFIFCSIGNCWMRGY